MIGDNDLDLGTQRYYHRQAVAELAELRTELHALRAELDDAHNDCDEWARAYTALRDDRHGWRARAILAEQQTTP